MKWLGSYQVVELRSNCIFLIKNLIDLKREEVHRWRLKFFCNKHFEATEKLIEHFSYQLVELLLKDSYKDIRKKQGVTELQVKLHCCVEQETDWLTSIHLLKIYSRFYTSTTPSSLKLGNIGSSISSRHCVYCAIFTFVCMRRCYATSTPCTTYAARVWCASRLG